MWHLFHYLISPRNFYNISNKLLPFLSIAFAITFGYGLIGGLYFAPPDYFQGDGFRIIYIHVPCAFLSLFIYAVMAMCAFVGIVFRLKLAFLVIRHSISIGAIFTFLALLTGSLWGKPMWGTWWIWDARLTSELILLFLYIGIIFFQSAIAQNNNKDRIISILILIGFIDIPIIHYSVYWWNTLHQGATLNILSKSSIDNSMLYPLLAMIVSFLFYYVIILFFRLRYTLIAIESKPHWLEAKIK